MKIPDFYEEPNHEHNLIIEICQRVDGVGKVTASAVAGYLDTVGNFANCDVSDLLALTKASGKPILKLEQAEAIITVRDEYLPAGSTDIRQLWMTYLVGNFVQRAIGEISETDFDKLLVNPFFIKAFNFKDHRAIITFYFYQKVSYSIVTFWWETVERMLLISGGSPVYCPAENGERRRRQHQEFVQEVEYILADPGLWEVITQKYGGMRSFLAWIENLFSTGSSISDLLQKQLSAVIAECEWRYNNGKMVTERFPRSGSMGGDISY